MSYTGIYYISGDKGGDEFIPAPFLCKTAGEYGNDFTVFGFSDVGYNKTNRTVDTGNYCDIPYSSLTDTYCAFFAWNYSFYCAEVNDKVMGAVTNRCPRFEYSSLTVCFCKRRKRLQGRELFRSASISS